MHDHAWDSTLLAVGLEPQLFVDNLLTASAHDATRRWHRPRRSQKGPLFTEHRPWEHRLWTAYYGSTTLIRACQWQSKTAHSWQSKTAHLHEGPVAGCRDLGRGR